MRVIWLMGGTGTRFLKGGYTTPKPLLPVKDKRLIQLAMETTNRLSDLQHHYLVSNQELATQLHLLGLRGCFHLLEHRTPGALQTLLTAERCVNQPEEVLVADCDSFLNPVEFKAVLETFRAGIPYGVRGGVTVRRTDDPICSFARLDEAWFVQETREKDPFTRWSTTGPYWFASGHELWVAAAKAAAAHHTSISPVYNYLPGRTKALPVESFQHLGTPEAYEAAIKLLCSTSP